MSLHTEAGSTPRSDIVTSVHSRAISLSSYDSATDSIAASMANERKEPDPLPVMRCSVAYETLE
jgi:hypothetical protein